MVCLYHEPNNLHVFPIVNTGMFLIENPIISIFPCSKHWSVLYHEPNNVHHGSYVVNTGMSLTVTLSNQLYVVFIHFSANNVITSCKSVGRNLWLVKDCNLSPVLLQLPPCTTCQCHYTWLNETLILRTAHLIYVGK